MINVTRNRNDDNDPFDALEDKDGALAIGYSFVGWSDTNGMISCSTPNYDAFECKEIAVMKMIGGVESLVSADEFMFFWGGKAVAAPVKVPPLSSFGVVLKNKPTCPVYAKFSGVLHTSIYRPIPAWSGSADQVKAILSGDARWDDGDSTTTDYETVGEVFRDLG